MGLNQARQWVGTVRRWSRFIGGPHDRQPVEYFKGQKIINVSEDKPLPAPGTDPKSHMKVPRVTRIHKYRLMNFWGDAGESLSFFVHESLTHQQAETIVMERYLKSTTERI